MDSFLTTYFVRDHCGANPGGDSDPELVAFNDRFNLALGDKEAAPLAPFRPRPDDFYCVGLMNADSAQQTLSAGVEADIIRGLYRLSAPSEGEISVRLVGSGDILPETIAAAELLDQDWQIEAEVWRATSYSQLAREADGSTRWNRRHPKATPRRSHLHNCLAGDIPVVAASDCVRAWPQLIGPSLRAPFHALGIDGFGRSDTQAQLRRFSEVDRYQIVLAALTALREQHKISAATCAAAIARYGIDSERLASWIS